MFTALCILTASCICTCLSAEEFCKVPKCLNGKSQPYDGKRAKPVYHPIRLALFERFSSARNAASELSEDMVLTHFSQCIMYSLAKI